MIPSSQESLLSSPQDHPLRSLFQQLGTPLDSVIGGLAGLLIVLAIIMKAKEVGLSPWKTRKHHQELEALEKSVMVDETETKICEIDGRDHKGHEIDGYQYPGHEIDGQKLPGYELGAVELSHELEGNETPKHELPALEFPGGEMAVSGNPPRVKGQEIP